MGNTENFMKINLRDKQDCESHKRAKRKSSVFYLRRHTEI